VTARGAALLTIGDAGPLRWAMLEALLRSANLVMAHKIKTV
jgi:hypothetical protein